MNTAVTIWLFSSVGGIVDGSSQVSSYDEKQNKTRKRAN